MDEEKGTQQDTTEDDDHTLTPPDPQNGAETQEKDIEQENEKEATDLEGIELSETLKKPGKKESGSGAPRPIRIDPLDLCRLHNLFAPSADFRSKLAPGSNRPAYNIWLVYGPEHSGKLTTGVNLALRLLSCEPGKAKIYSYRRNLTDSLTLIDLVGRDKERGRAYILEDALDEHSGGLCELTSPWLDALDRALKANSSFLILTTEMKLRELETLSIGKVSAFPEDLHQAFEKHLDRFALHVEGVDVLESVVREARGNWHSVSRYLKKPVQIERFCYKLGDHLPEVSSENFEALAREAAYIGQASVRQAFGKLGDNQKLYALLVVLFEGIERTILDEIYSLLVRYLRAQGVSTLRDEREIGMEDVLEQIRARENETQQIIIEDAEFRDEVFRQIRNHRLLLYSLSTRLLALCEQFSAPEHWEVRRAIGGAIGRLAIQEMRGLRPISQTLDDLADHPQGGIASVAGFILAQICREEPQFRGEVLDRLNAWVRSGHPDRMWAAGAAAWRIYEALGPVRQAVGESSGDRWHRRVLEVIAALIRRAGRFSPKVLDGVGRKEVAAWSHQNLRCAFFALVRIGNTSPLSAASRIEEWLRSRRADPVRDVVQFACREVLEQATSGTRGLLPGEMAWLRLIQPLLTLDPDLAQVGDALMAAVAHWARLSVGGNDTEALDEIYLHLLKAANRLSGRSAKSFRAGLVRHWLINEEEWVRSHGRALLRRSHAMEGLPWRDLILVPGVVILDSSREARLNAGACRVFREILEVVGCYSEVTAAHLGGTKIPASRTGGVDERDLRSSLLRPRLLLPPLKQASGEAAEPSVVVALTWGLILDLADGQESSWWPPLLVAAGNWIPQSEGQEKKLDQVNVAVASPMPLTQDLDSIVTGIVHHLNSKPPIPLTKTSRAVAPWDNLTTLDQSNGSNTCLDRAALVIATLLDQSATDLAGCLQILRDWLNDTGELPARMASAGLRALLRYYIGPERHLEDSEKEGLLCLAFRLPPADEGAVETVLEAILAWMDEAPWAERISGGDALCLAWMRWFDGVIPHQARNLDRWLTEIEIREAAKKDQKDTVRQTLRRLRFRLSLGEGGTLPALDSGKKYGLFLLDTFSSDRVRGTNLSRLATDVIGRPEFRDISCLIFRLGRKAPLAVPGERLAREAILPAPGARLPRLLGPILEDLPPERILFALLFSAGPAIDADDWSEGPWSYRIRLYGPTDNPTAPEPFVRISPPYGDEGEAEVIVRNLKPLIAQGA